MPAAPHVSRDRTSARSRAAYKKRFGKKALKKTSRRGAYKNRAKRNFMIRRAPFVETKSKTSEDLVDQFGLTVRSNYYQSETPHKHINPEVFTCWKQGLGEAECIGSSVYVKYLKRKIQVRFPQPPFETTSGVDKEIPNIPQEYELVWGFVPMPLNHTEQTSPTAANTELEDINTHINQRVSDYFQDRADYLRFIPKKASTIRITGRKKVRPNMNRSAQMAPNVDYYGNIVGTIPDWQGSLYWPMQRKLHLEKSNDLANGNEGLFVNYSWLPFCVLLIKQYESIASADRAKYMPYVAYNDIIYYSDS